MCLYETLRAWVVDETNRPSPRAAMSATMTITRYMNAKGFTLVKSFKIDPWNGRWFVLVDLLMIPLSSR